MLLISYYRSGDFLAFNVLSLIPRSVWIHFGNPPKCYLAGTRGPCPANMKLGIQPNSCFGLCKCPCFVEINIRNRNRSPVLDPYLETKQGFCFDEIAHFASYKNNCYKLLIQGPCAENETLIVDKETKRADCKARDCPEKRYSVSEPERLTFTINYKGACLKIREICENGTTDANSFQTLKVVGTTQDNPNPSCIPSEDSVDIIYESFGLGKDLQANDCEQIGQHYSKILKRCIPLERGRIGYSVG